MPVYIIKESLKFLIHHLNVQKFHVTTMWPKKKKSDAHKDIPKV